MSTEDNKTLARRAYETFKQRNWSVYYEMMAPDVVYHNASMTIQGLEAYQQFLSLYLTAFPDMRLTIEDLIAEGDRVVVRQTFRGTHQGDLMGIPPAGKQVTTTGVDLFRLADGKSVEELVEWDVQGILQQLGVVPPPEWPE